LLPLLQPAPDEPAAESTRLQLATHHSLKERSQLRAPRAFGPTRTEMVNLSTRKDPCVPGGHQRRFGVGGTL